MVDKTLNYQMTEAVMSYINKGYVINGKTMSGSNGTEHIDLVKGRDFIRVTKDRKSCTRSVDGFYGDKIVLLIGNTNLKYKNTDIVWDSELKTVASKTYYIIGNYYRNYCLTDNIEEMRMCTEKSKKRYLDRYIDTKKEYTDIQHLKVGFKAVKKQPRTKCIHLEDIEKVVRNSTRGKVYFTVYYNTKSAKKTLTIGA